MYSYACVIAARCFYFFLWLPIKSPLVFSLFLKQTMAIPWISCRHLPVQYAHSAYTISDDHWDNEVASFAFNNLSGSVLCACTTLAMFSATTLLAELKANEQAAPGSQEYG